MTRRICKTPAKYEPCGTLGVWLRSERGKTGASLRLTAKRIGVSAPFWSDVELGRRLPSMDTFKRAIRVLACSRVKACRIWNAEQTARWMATAPELIKPHDL